MARSPRPEAPAEELHMEQLPPVMRPEQAFAYLGIGRTRGYQLLREGGLFHVRIGRAIRIPRSAIERFLSEPAEAAPAGPNPLRIAG